MNKNPDTESAIASAAAETGLLGAVMLDAAKVMPHLEFFGFHEGFFTAPDRRALYAVVREMSVKGSLIDPVTVTEALRESGDLDRLGGTAYLTGLVDATPTPAHAEHYARLVREAYHKRSVAAVARSIAVSAADPEKTGDQVIAEGVESLSRIIVGEVMDKRTVADIAREAIKAWRAIHHGERRMVGLSSGLFGLDFFMGGLQRKHMTLLAARPSAGKTSLAMTIARECCEVLGKKNAETRVYGKHVAVVAMDTDREMLVHRQLCFEASVSLSKLNYGYASNDQFDQLDAAVETLNSLPIHYLDHTRDWNAIASWLRALKAAGKLDLVIIDYIQQIQVEGRRFFGDTERVTWVSGAVKALLRELNVPGVVLAQLNRELERAEAARPPKASDMRDSGSLEQDADNILMLWKDPVWEPSNDFEAAIRAVRGELVKQKNGPQGSIPFYFYPAYFRFTDVPRLDYCIATRRLLDWEVEKDRWDIQQQWVRYNRILPAEDEETPARKKARK